MSGKANCFFVIGRNNRLFKHSNKAKEQFVKFILTNTKCRKLFGLQ
jgi:hypothetical protein